MSRSRALLACVALVALVPIGCESERPASSPQLDAKVQEQRQAQPGALRCGPIGESIACVGPGGCRGGQVCMADGSFGPCDCEGPQLAQCAPSGVLFRCIGEGDCVGSQACGSDGRFGACECATRPGSVNDLWIEEPAAGSTVGGVLTVSGRAEGDVERVEVSIAGGPWLFAHGVDPFSLSFDSAELAEGPMTIVVQAHGRDDSVAQQFVQVELRHAHPLIGTWQRSDDSWYRGCRVSFGADRQLKDNCGLFSYFVGWVPESAGLVRLLQPSSEMRVRYEVSASGDVLTFASHYWYGVSGTYARVSREYQPDLPPFPPEIDVDGGWPDYDGGLDYDAGY